MPDRPERCVMRVKIARVSTPGYQWPLMVESPSNKLPDFNLAAAERPW